MTTVYDLYRTLQAFAPFETAESYDNVGILCGDRFSPVHKIMVALDITEDVVAEASSVGADVIVSHHPVIFDPVRRINEDSPVFHLLTAGIHAICVHTNLDFAEFGVNDALAKTLSLTDLRWLSVSGEQAIGKIGILSEPIIADRFAHFIKTVLPCNGVSFNTRKEPLKTVAVCGGSGGSLWEEAMRCGADALVTGEAKYNHYLDAAAHDFCIFAAGHYATEQVVVPVLQQILHAAYPQIPIVISAHKDVVQHI